MPTDRQSLSEQLEEKVYNALRLWHAPDLKGNPLHQLRMMKMLQREGSDERQASNQLLAEEIERLKTSHADRSAILQLRFADGLPAHVVAARQNISEATVWRWQQEGIRLLAEAMLSREEKLRQQHRKDLQRHLPPATYQHIFGVEQLIAQLSGQCLQPHSPWLIAIEGIGGIGKTTLADALVRHLIEHDFWEDIAWVTAQQRTLNLGGGLKHVAKPALTVEEMVDALYSQLFAEHRASSTPQGMTYDGRLAALESRLKQQPHLLVIDNLETHQDVDALLTTLRRFVAPSKVIITTRQRFFDHADIYHFTLPELSEDNALLFVRQEAKTRNLPQLDAASNEEMYPIYNTVGGNPLALRLVVGQLHIHPLNHVIDSLMQANGLPVNNLYTYIYRQIWETLNEAERQTLILMLLTSPQGESLNELNAIATGQIEETTLSNALDRLVMLSLVNISGNLQHHRYAIHSLTRSFLHRQVLKWEEG